MSAGIGCNKTHTPSLLRDLTSPDGPRGRAAATLKHTLNMQRNGALTGDRDWSPGPETAGGGQSGVRLAASYPGHK
jgi:hypothetical protein